jgi:hypothetical protein
MPATLLVPGLPREGADRRSGGRKRRRLEAERPGGQHRAMLMACGEAVRLSNAGRLAGGHRCGTHARCLGQARILSGRNEASRLFGRRGGRIRPPRPHARGTGRNGPLWGTNGGLAWGPPASWARCLGLPALLSAQRGVQRGGGWRRGARAASRARCQGLLALLSAQRGGQREGGWSRSARAVVWPRQLAKFATIKIVSAHWVPRTTSTGEQLVATTAGRLACVP